MESQIIHKPVMIKEVLSFIPENSNIVVDATLGEGGHTKAMLDLNLEVHSFERDKNILKIAKKRLSNYKKFYYYNNTYDKMIDSLPKNIIGNVDFILYDLGVSMFHFKKAERGFSFNENNKLDMRLGINKINAYEVINKYEKKDLERIFKEYGEIKNYSKLAEIIIKERNKKNIETAKELENIIFHNSDKSKKYGKINPSTLIFQAIRIEVNDELNILKKSIENIKNILKKYGVVVIISYHSLEDRIVKRFFKDNEKTKNKDGIFKLLNSKVLKPTNEEIKLNIASRSAKLRAAQLL
ncbi:16S rRNA (cytosine(1402)-N(4))-methyltransferase RsmH [Brachyspira aalborgi]|uniref:Ribosomal RNA small subunit methyltransferase H n=3 Tax=Brachyspira aalborgi TaxID=29522 RepID=A0AB38PZ91_9SPIR|nr:16S rRNA (cytosine(1402)-N(4))-methyltransferase RsmH [Brachyspira aalborgi]MBS4762899.1 16S rRNA (cytosine(1402)-N(4))-methyltransferase RsmH [Brachyspira sp.]TXJ14446.1 16S rRNA (cytosine(1402)-N(4))-methyltransferase RsmH [Brachyspira aalborgi]TXJ19227.1 16S rRNA (cytosine(1402)-N(4))-methyltransferase RsmH [Brachyspira aalborgi]TXJ25353.1 16S rRNA (cytosine(1402)-N(4))-methyltransferase RsmH [Brachyspira aalborgi]TXJ31334.1 16S rRNA (cytosine(1402)-N(4))-methyltransferase RsmH [Brachysp